MEEKEPRTEELFLEVLKVLNEEPLLDREGQERVLKKISYLLKDYSPPSENERKLYFMCQDLMDKLERSLKYNELLLDTLNHILNLLEILLKGEPPHSDASGKG